METNSLILNINILSSNRGIKKTIYNCISFYYIWEENVWILENKSGPNHYNTMEIKEAPVSFKSTNTTNAHLLLLSSLFLYLHINSKILFVNFYF